MSTDAKSEIIEVTKYKIDGKPHKPSRRTALQYIAGGVALLGRTVLTAGKLVKEHPGAAKIVLTSAAAVGTGVAAEKILDAHEEGEKNKAKNEFVFATGLEPVNFRNEELEKLKGLLSYLPERTYHDAHKTKKINLVSKLTNFFQTDSLAEGSKIEGIQLRDGLFRSKNSADQMYELTRALIVQRLNDMPREEFTQFFTNAKQALNIKDKQDLQIYLHTLRANIKNLTANGPQQISENLPRPGDAMNYFAFLQDISEIADHEDAATLSRVLCIYAGAYGLGREGFSQTLKLFYGEDKGRVQSLYNLFKAKLFYDQDVKPPHEIGK